MQLQRLNENVWNFSTQRATLAQDASLRTLNVAVGSRMSRDTVQVVRGNLRALRYMLKVLGDDWAFILTDVTKGSQGNDERLAFLFDTRRVKPSGLACATALAPSPQGRSRPQASHGGVHLPAFCTTAQVNAPSPFGVMSKRPVRYDAEH